MAVCAPPGHDLHAVRHDGLAVQAGLPVEEHHVAVVQVALHDVAHLIRQHTYAAALLCQASTAPSRVLAGSARHVCHCALE